MSKRGDGYLRLLLIHGLRAAPRAAQVRQRKDQPLDRLQAWALALPARQGHNKTAVALANKVARRIWVMEHHHAAFDGNHCSLWPMAAAIE